MSLIVPELFELSVVPSLALLKKEACPKSAKLVWANSFQSLIKSSLIIWGLFSKRLFVSSYLSKIFKKNLFLFVV